MRWALRRPYRHGAGRAPSAAAGVGAVPLPHGPEPLEPADRGRTRLERVGRAGHDGTAAPWPGRQGSGGEAGRRGGDRRGLRGGRAQRPARGRGQKGRIGRRRRLAGAPGRGTLEKDKPPILGLIQRGGPVVLRMLANVQQITIQPILEAAVAKDTLVHTDEYGVYARLPAWGYQHETVCHAQGEYARDEDGDGFCEVHVNTIEGFWSLLRSWLRPHPGSRRRSCRTTSASSSSCTTHAVAAKPCSPHSLPPWSYDPDQHPASQQEPYLIYLQCVLTTLTRRSGTRIIYGIFLSFINQQLALRT